MAYVVGGILGVILIGGQLLLQHRGGVNLMVNEFNGVIISMLTDLVESQAVLKRESDLIQKNKCSN